MNKKLFYLCTASFLTLSACESSTTSRGSDEHLGLEQTNVVSGKSNEHSVLEQTDESRSSSMTDEEVAEANQAVFDRVNNELAIEELVTKRFTLESTPPHSLSAIPFHSLLSRSSEWRFAIFAVDMRWEIECLRRMDNGDYYAVFEIEEGGRVFRFFTKEGGFRESHGIYVNRPGSESDYSQLQVGDSHEKIFDIDYGFSLPDYIGMNFVQLNGVDGSLHLLEDMLILIQYDDNKNIINIRKYPDKRITVPAGTWLGTTMPAMTLEDEVFDFNILPKDFPKQEER